MSTQNAEGARSPLENRWPQLQAEVVSGQMATAVVPRFLEAKS